MRMEQVFENSGGKYTNIDALRMYTYMKNYDNAYVYKMDENGEPILGDDGKPEILMTNHNIFYNNQI